MPGGAATAAKAAAEKAFESAGEMREVLTLLLSEIDRDSDLGSQLRAAKVSYRYVFPDLGLILNVASSEEVSRNVRWSFGDDPDWNPKLTMTMPSEVANRYLQGRENLAIAMARGRISCSGDSRAALSLLPIDPLLNACYRKVLERHYPHLLLGPAAS